MLPGFRFLFAAIMLSMSLLMFGLGAAALLRAAHEEFASNPSWRAAPEVMFAQQTEPTTPVLAMLRVDTPVAEKVQGEAAATIAPAEQAAITSATAEPERIAALKPEEASPAEIAKAETAKGETVHADVPVAESPAAGDAAPASLPVSGDETRVATIATVAVSSRETQVVPAQPEPMGAQVAPGADIAATSIATLGGPPVSIETRPPARLGDAKPDQSAIGKHQQARRAARHRRLAAAHARLAAQTLPQPPFPFGPPAPATRTR
jgi:hypothetical protein